MADVLAECQDCGRPFVAGAMGGGGWSLGHAQDVYIESMEICGTQVRLGGVEVGGCPHCGGTGRIPDRLYDALRSTVTVLRELDSDHSLWLIQALRNLPEEEEPRSEVVDDLLREVGNGKPSQPILPFSPGSS